MKKLVFCFMAMMLVLTFTSCSHHCFKGYALQKDAEFCYINKILNDEVLKGVLDNQNSAFYATEEDENGNLRSVQVVEAAKIAQAKYANSSLRVSAGDFVMLWKQGPFIYLVKCDDSLPFQSRVDEARRWCAQNLEVAKFLRDRNSVMSHYPRLLRLR